MDTYIGWRLHGTVGVIVAGSLFVNPSIFVMLLLSCLAVAHIGLPEPTAVLYGTQPAVVAVVAWKLVDYETNQEEKFP